MSYRERVENLLLEIEKEHGRKTRHEVDFVREGTFDIQIRVLDPGPVQEFTISLAAGMTPRVSQTIRRWFCAIIAPDSVIDEPAPLPIAPLPKRGGRWITVRRPALF